MIEITCTKTDKARIINAITDSAVCLFPRKQSFCALSRDFDCRKCLEEKIKWTIKERGAANA